ncbi:MAG TPA: hypothetical protein VF221_01595, partial [Chloroflexota bacterium]
GHRLSRSVRDTKGALMALIDGRPAIIVLLVCSECGASGLMPGSTDNPTTRGQHGSNCPAYPAHVGDGVNLRIKED